MAKVRMKTILAGPGRAAARGDVLEVSADEAAQLVIGGFAEALDAAARDAVARAPARPAPSLLPRAEAIRSSRLAQEHIVKARGRVGVLARR